MGLFDKEMNSAKAFDKKQLSPLEESVRGIVGAHYDMCLSNCGMKKEEMGSMQACKERCYSNIMVKYKMVAHQSRDAEENLFRQCLAEKYPNVQQTDYSLCTMNVYSQRVEMLMNHYANTAENLLDEIH